MKKNKRKKKLKEKIKKKNKKHTEKKRKGWGTAYTPPPHMELFAAHTDGITVRGIQTADPWTQRGNTSAPTATAILSRVPHASEPSGSITPDPILQTNFLPAEKSNRSTELFRPCGSGCHGVRDLPTTVQSNFKIPFSSIPKPWGTRYGQDD